MKDSKFGKNKARSFVEFDTEIGRLRLGSEGKSLFLEINETKSYLTDASGNLSADITGDVTGNVTGDLTGKVISGDGIEIISEVVTVPSANLVGSDAGDLGHVDGAILIPAPTSDYVLEFVAAVLIYDFATAAYTGGGDDNVIQIGSSGTQVALTAAIAGADLLEAAGDKIALVTLLSAADIALPVGTPLSIAGTALTQPGLPEITTFQMTVAEDTGGIVDIDLNGVTHNIPITADTVDVNAGEIQAYIDALPGYGASVLTDTVTVTSVATGVQTDATFSQGTANSSACTVTVTQQGVDAAEGVLRAHITYKRHTTNL